LRRAVAASSEAGWSMVGMLHEEQMFMQVMVDLHIGMLACSRWESTSQL
jgi:hypothetical protein